MNIPMPIQGSSGPVRITVKDRRNSWEWRRRLYRDGILLPVIVRCWNYHGGRVSL